MATNPMMQPEEAQEAGKGYCIEINVGSDGSIRVSVESEEYEAQEHANMPEGTPEPEGKAVASIDEAMALVQQIFANDGEMSEMPNEADEPKLDGQAEFEQGFKNIRGTPEQQQHGRR